MVRTHRAAVSVIVRTKDRPDFLRRALADIARQTFSDYEVVIVNDGGDAAEVDALVAGAVPSMAGDIVQLHHAAARGRADAANAGIEASSAELVVLHDDDDSWEPEFLERCIAHLGASDDAGVVTRAGVIYERIEGDSVVEEGREILNATMHDISFSEMLRRNCAATIAFVYRRTLHDEIGLYDPELERLEDWDFGLRVLASTKRIGFVDGEPLAWWHLRKDAKGSTQNISLSGEESRTQYLARVLDKHLLDGSGTSPVLGLALLLTHVGELQIERSDALETHLRMVAGHSTELTSRLGAQISLVNDVVLRHTLVLERLERATAELAEIQRRMLERQQQVSRTGRLWGKLRSQIPRRR